MAKEKFIRSKPHVNVSTTRRLTRRGISPLGVYQVTRGMVVTNPRDRLILAETVAEADAWGPSRPQLFVALVDNQD